MEEYKISISLEEHRDDVRGVAFPHPSTVISASRDATARLWNIHSCDPPKYTSSVISHGTSFMNAIAYVPPTSAYPHGLLAAGSQDALIEVRSPGKESSEGPEVLLAGHTNAVCALAICVKNNLIVSGSWDSTARLWHIGSWQCTRVLEGHQGSVWAVLGYDQNIIITGCADRVIRIFDTSGKILRELRGSTGPVRALCHILSEHSTGANFASAGNDGMVRLWTLDGRQVGELHGHESFIYSLASLVNGELVSSGEDRTLRIWKDCQCIQTITHPAISVWGVAVCHDNGDIVSGASDRIVRVFTKARERQGALPIVEAFKDAVKSFAIPQQQVDSVGRESVPGPHFISEKSGTREGQIQMIKEADGKTSAYQWSSASQTWINVGTVVDATAKHNHTTSYLGAEYDYVFDVDIAEGAPPLKLPYNISQNPYEVASNFILTNELPSTYLDQIVQFINRNTENANIDLQRGEPQSDGRSSSGPSLPQGNDSINSLSTFEAPTRRAVLPQCTYLAIKTANIRSILRKIGVLNEQLQTEGSRDVILSPELLTVLDDGIEPLEKALSRTPSIDVSISNCVPIALHMLTEWPASCRLPALDLIRLLAAVTPKLVEHYKGSDKNIIDDLETYGFDDQDRSNNIMLAIRALGNLFETAQGRDLADACFDQIYQLIEVASKTAGFITNHNLIIAVSNLYLNYAVLLTSAKTTKLSSPGPGRFSILLRNLTSLLLTATDSEAIYRGLVATGTLLAIGKVSKLDDQASSELTRAIKRAASAVQEPRVVRVVNEIQEKVLMDLS